MTKRIEDLGNVEVEHLLGLGTGLPLVKIRAESDLAVLVGQVDPDSARRIAGHLLEAAARAEYEHDLYSEARRLDLTAEAIGFMLGMVRVGERRRHEGGA